MKLKLNGRPIEVTEFDNDDDIPLILQAFYLDGAQEELTEEECDQAVESNFDACSFAIYEKQISAAEALYEGDR